MPTGTTYVPALGDYAAPFSLLSGDATVVPRDATAAFQGAPRPGKIKWAFSLVIPDTAANNDEAYTVDVPVPFSPNLFTAANFLVMANSFFPLVSILPATATAAAAAAVSPIITIGATGTWSVANQTLQCAVLLPAAVLTAQYLVTIDFSHSLIN